MYYTRKEKEINRLKWEKINLNKQLIKLCKDLSIDDWRRIRSGDYYQIRDELTEDSIKQMYFIINRIKKYT
jgi:hypothetical protein